MGASSTTSIDSYGWSVTWCRAFPTLLDLFCDTAELAHQLRPLAWTTLYPNDKTAVVSRRDVEESHVIEWQHSLGYGEIDPDTVCYLMHWLKTNGLILRVPHDGQNTTIFDLGSGDGKVILATALSLTAETPTAMTKISNATTTLVGFEIVPHLHNQALTRMQTYARDMGSETNHHIVIHLTCDDFTRHQARIARDADLIWIHATVFEDALFHKVQEICAACRSGTLFIVISRPLQNSAIETILSKRLKMSWGDGMVFVQRRRQRIMS